MQVWFEFLAAVPPGPRECEAVSMQNAEPVKKRVSRKLISIAIAVIVLAVALLSYSLVNPQEESVKICAIIPLSGPYAYMAEIKDNLEMAVDKINKWSGLNNRPIELIVADCESDPVVAVELFHELEEDHHPLAYIAVTSTIYIALAPLADEAEVVLMGLAVAVPDVTVGHDWCFRYYTTTEIETACIVNMIEDTLSTKVGLIYTDDAYGASFAGDIENIATQCGCTIMSEAVTFSDTDFSEEVGNLSLCDVIVAFGVRTSLINMLTEIDDSGYDGYVMAGSGASAPSVRELPVADGVYVAAPLVYKESNVLASRYVSDFETTYGYSPSHMGITGYDGMMLIWGLMVDSELTRENLRSNLHSGYAFSGVLGSMKVPLGDHEINFPLFPAVIDGGDLWFL